jgi:hypothetical protein
MKKILLISALSFSFYASAKLKECKNLKVSQCKKRTDCHWVKSYKKSNGVKVQPFCRSNPKSEKVSQKTNNTSNKN